MRTHTEHEAKKKWCPFSRVALMGGTFSRAIFFSKEEASDGKPFTSCIGSDCMAWRWHFDQKPPEGAGYCGLVG